MTANVAKVFQTGSPTVVGGHGLSRVVVKDLGCSYATEASSSRRNAVIQLHEVAVQTLDTLDPRLRRSA